MALQTSLTSPHGLSLPEAYININSFTGTKHSVTVVLHYFINAASRVNGGLPLWTETHTLDDVKDGATLQQLYEVLKTMPYLLDAVDV